MYDGCVPAVMLSFPDAESLADCYEKQLSKGRVFLPGGAGLTERTACEIVVKHGEREVRLAAEVVYVRAEDPGRGVGLQLAPFDEAKRTELVALVQSAAPEATEELAEEEEGEKEEGEGGAAATHLHERMRSLSSTDQQRIAAGGTLPERILLERTYGPNVWETLLRNPRLTTPEVARIGRKGTLPRPLVELIAANASWISSPEVQRALLSNPRSSSAVVAKVLHSMPKADLQRVPQQTAYPMPVRQVAKKMLMEKA
jgi:hypothetical protein